MGTSKCRLAYIPEYYNYLKKQHQQQKQTKEKTAPVHPEKARTLYRSVKNSEITEFPGNPERSRHNKINHEK